MNYVITFRERTDIELIKSVNGKIISELKNIPRLVMVELTQEMVDKLILNPEVQAITPIPKEKDVELHGNFTSDAEKYVHHLTVMRATDYWERGITGKGVRVAVLDYNVGLHHALNLTGGSSLGDPDHYTYTTNTTANVIAHGTHCAGLVVGKPVKNSTLGTIGGMAPDSEIFALKFSGRAVPGYPALEAIDWCIENKIDIITCSIQYYSTPLVSGVAFETAHNAGIIVVCSAGNDNLEIPYGAYPASSPSVITVSGLNEQLKRHTYSYGNAVDFAAPCRSVSSLNHVGRVPNYINNTFLTANGTSSSAPLVAGTFALYKQAFPEKTIQELIDMVAKGARKINGVHWDKYVGFGLPQPTKEIMAVPKVSEIGGLEFTGNGDYIDCGKSETLNIKNKITLIAKVKQKARNQGHIFAKANSNGSQIFYGMLAGQDGLYPEWRNGTTQNKPKYVRSLSDMQTHTVAFVYDYPKIRMYVDGIEMVEQFNMGFEMELSAAADKLLIGSNGGTSTGSFAGTLFNAKVYNRALSFDEITEDYNGAVSTNGLVLHYDFMGTFENTATDLSGNGNHGTIYGAKSRNKKIDKVNPAVKDRLVPPLEVTNVTATSTDHSITLNWSNSLIPSVGRKYDIYVPSSDRPVLSLGGTVVTATFSLLEADQEYEYRIVTVNQNGDSSDGVTIKVKTKVDVTKPAAITGLLSTSSATDVNLGWTASASTDTYEYEVYKGAVGSTINNAVLVGKTTNTLFGLEGLNPSTSYEVFVIATDKAGNKSDVVSKTVTTNASMVVLHQDSFNRADATTLGTPDVGNAYSYIDATSRQGIVGNQVTGTTTPAFTKPAYIDVTTANYALEISLPKLGAYEGIYPRLTTAYSNSVCIYKDATTKQWILFKLINGQSGVPWGEPSMKENGEGVIYTNAIAKDGDKMRIECYSDGLLKFFVNGKLEATVKDTIHMSYAQRVGFGVNDTVARLDDFKVEQIPFYK